MMPPSITKYGSPVLDAQIVALRPHCARTALKASPKKKTHDWGRLGLLISLGPGPNPLLKRAKRNTIHKAHIYSGVTCPFAFDRCTAQWSL